MCLIFVNTDTGETKGLGLFFNKFWRLEESLQYHKCQLQFILLPTSPKIIAKSDFHLSVLLHFIYCLVFLTTGLSYFQIILF